MTLTIELEDESAARLMQQARAHGVTLEEWVEALAREKVSGEQERAAPNKAQLAITRILEIQKCVKPDPEGWTIRDYIDQGRR